MVCISETKIVWNPNFYLHGFRMLPYSGIQISDPHFNLLKNVLLFRIDCLPSTIFCNKNSFQIHALKEHVHVHRHNDVYDCPHCSKVSSCCVFYNFNHVFISMPACSHPCPLAICWHPYPHVHLIAHLWTSFKHMQFHPMYSHPSL